MNSGSGGRGRGRPRSGSSGLSRGAILAAAAAEFAERGYEGASLRSVARRASVDAALIHHYFAGKADLLAAAIGAPLRPDTALDQIIQGPRDEIGAGIVQYIVDQFAAEDHRQRAVAFIKSAMTAEPVGLLARAFISQELTGRLAAIASPPDPQLRATLALSQVAGLLITRYVLELEPLASASGVEVVEQVGPVVQLHLFG